MFEPKQYASIYCKISLIHVVVGQKRAGTTTIIVAVLWICKVQRSLQPKRLKSHRNYVVRMRFVLKCLFLSLMMMPNIKCQQPYQESKSVAFSDWETTKSCSVFLLYFHCTCETGEPFLSFWQASKYAIIRRLVEKKKENTNTFKFDK